MVTMAEVLSMVRQMYREEEAQDHADFLQRLASWDPLSNGWSPISDADRQRVLLMVLRFYSREHRDWVERG